jgi:cytochrome c5
MKSKIMWFAGILMLATAAIAADPPKSSNSTADPAAISTTTASAERNSEAENIRTEGEKRFRANCSRCHAAPHKFPPRMMATIVRHMRVRATITDADMRHILAYMTQ